MLTARGEEVDRVVGLELGADDYICKPFSIRELLARIKAVLRRVSLEETKPTPVSSTLLTGPGGILLNLAQREAFVQTSLLELSRLEFDLLHTFLSHLGWVLSREQLLSQVWGYDYPGDDRAVDSAIKRLRAKLRAADPRADGIIAVRGIGYKFKRSDEG
jgi:DNA-binding response OmpR family regulator